MKKLIEEVKKLFVNLVNFYKRMSKSLTSFSCFRPKETKVKTVISYFFYCLSIISLAPILAHVLVIDVLVYLLTFITSGTFFKIAELI